MTKPKNPCGLKCPKRSATCKFDGTCEEWPKYEKAQADYREHKNKITRENSQEQRRILRSMDKKRKRIRSG